VPTDPARLEFHLYLPQLRLSLDDLVVRSRAAEAAGFDGVALMDHLAPPAAVDQPMFEAVTTAMWLAGHTERLTIGHLVLCDGFRHPALLARQAVALDHASGGRFELGIGAGSVPAELAVFGLPTPTAAQRVARLGETLEVLALLWSGERVDYEGRYVTLVGAQQLPVPTRPIPVVVGGTGDKMLELVSAHADWWNVPTHQSHRLHEARDRIGGARVSVQQLVTFIPDGASRHDVTALAERRFGFMGPDRPVTGDGPELVAHFRGLRADGVERVYTWLTDFASPDGLAAFGRQVIDALADG
jgi:alkanesulfonate monooxygenase SsuD/methylene tetrahydromethanopterin reductase-like flavin-dependent oxidoreductase (luciferase family)